ncbi:MAG: hypothetical protein CTY25_03715 [Methylobacterium sp.]|nr:MAG: hypothetical protein CTY25_03715 [Methylobacterium sp.]
MSSLAFRGAVCRAAALFLGVAAVALPASASGPRRAAPAAPAAQPAPGLTFFTLADRIAALKAKGAIPAGPAAPAIEPASLEADAPPAAQDLGLRLRPNDQPVETIFGAMAVPVPSGELAAKWTGMLVRWSRDEAVIAHCAAGACRHPGAAKWLEIRKVAAQRKGLDQLDYVHATLNRSIHYATDFQMNGVADYWASPLEAVERAGDCEDYAIAKYMMLRALGVDPGAMRIVAIFENVSGQFHAVLAVRHEGEWLFLDNKRGGVAREADYSGIRPIATVDEGGQSMLVAVPRQPKGPGLRLTTL